MVNTPLEVTTKFMDSTISMSSLEIASVVETQHGNVRISIDRLAAKGIIKLPPMQLVENKQSLSPNNKTQTYIFYGEQGKRDSIIVVAQLSPEFTAKLVDRWSELERRNSIMDTTTQLANAVILAQQVLTEKQLMIQHLETKVEADAPKVEFFDHVTESDVWLDMKAVAKRLDFVGVGRNKLFDILRKGKVLDSRNEPYQKYVDRGYFKVVPVPFGVDKVSQKTVVSYKGVDWIRKNLTKHSFLTHSDYFKEAV